MQQVLSRNVKPPVGVVFDTGMTRIDEALALGLAFGLEGKRECRVVGLTVSRPSLKAAAFCDAVQHLYAGPPSPFMRVLPVGMELHSKRTGPDAMFEPALSAPDVRYEIRKVNDTADPAAAIRNAFTAHHDGNCLMVVSGPAGNLLKALSLRGAKELAAAKVRLLTIVPDPNDVEDTSKLLAEWPGPVVLAPQEVGEQALYPAANIQTGFTWAQSPHPIVEAYKAYKPMPYDAPTPALAAILYAVRAKENYFKVSDPGTLSMTGGGQFKLTPSPEGKHRHLIADPAQKDRLTAVYAELVSAKPVPRPRFRPMVVDDDKPKPPANGKPPEAKPSAVPSSTATPQTGK